MKIAFGSDIHLEFGEAAPALDPIREADILVLAGDICTGRDKERGYPTFLKYAQSCAQSLDIPVIAILGNHELYSQEMDSFVADCRTHAEDMHNVHFLENNTIEIKDIRFAGCLLWSDFLATNDPAYARHEAARSITDYSAIRVAQTGRRKGRKLTPLDTAKKNADSRRFLEHALAEPFDGPTVAITHFPPVFMSDPQYAGSPLSAYFCNDWQSAIETGALAPDVWITGHTHFSTELAIGRTRIISQQRGYPGELGPFKWGVIELS
ncbi:metallophosphoesterase [Kordiimonas marina]|uniref:metallophosphoesterase n=1 Tax=Kordiimonas marina TaxID=2872312 RepID=UPI001FF0F6BE|nr:metallophosphoesterase [Kordiimonas marina]MCJ9430026.1 metallophosphoesterase [Kordiimonas marina]